MADAVKPVTASKGPDHKLVLATLGMTEEEYVHIMSAHGDWHAATDDGWVKAHDALRYEMAEMRKALDAVITRMKQGEALQPWVIRNLQKYWPWFVKAVHHHHDNEELIVFPELSKLITVPPKMSDDHVTLMQQMDAVSKAIMTLKLGTPVENLVAFNALREKFVTMQDNMCEHLLEEEVLGLPLLRKAMTKKQFTPIEKRIVAGMTVLDLGWVLRPFPSNDARRAWMSNVAGIPGLVQKFIMLPAVPKFQKKIGNLLEECKQGRQMAAPSMWCFAA